MWRCCVLHMHHWQKNGKQLDLEHTLSLESKLLELCHLIRQWSAQKKRKTPVFILESLCLDLCAAESWLQHFPNYKCQWKQRDIKVERIIFGDPGCINSGFSFQCWTVPQLIVWNNMFLPYQFSAKLCCVSTDIHIHVSVNCGFFPVQVCSRAAANSHAVSILVLALWSFCWLTFRPSTVWCSMPKPWPFFCKQFWVLPTQA